MISAIRAQSTRRTSMTFFQQASPYRTFSAGLLTRHPDANAFPAFFLSVTEGKWHRCSHPIIRAAHSCGTVGDSHPIPF